VGMNGKDAVVDAGIENVVKVGTATWYQHCDKKKQPLAFQILHCAKATFALEEDFLCLRAPLVPFVTW
jgi:hypothetical protein